MNEKFSYLRGASPDYLEGLFTQYLENPDSIHESWRYLFEGMELSAANATDSELEPSRPLTTSVQTVAPSSNLEKELRVLDLIRAYRTYGRFQANLNPLETTAASRTELALETYGLSSADLDQSFQAGALFGGGAQTLKQILDRLRTCYCGTIAAELDHIQEPKEREWLKQKVESLELQKRPEVAARKAILKRLTESEQFERFLHTRYVAQKRFSIEGSEGTLPMLDQLIDVSANHGVTEVVVGMAHRGRLNVLCNLFGKKPEYMFTEFEGNYKLHPEDGEGDVKYHKGWIADLTTFSGKKAHLSLAFNPSHLETVNPVMEGMARARQDLIGDQDRTKVLPIVIHGDAAFAGQGLVYETLNLSLVPAYETGGTLHIIINNQVGFTTSPQDSRSTPFCSDLARFLNAPIFHVNGDDAEAVWNLAKLCADYRQKFKKDVFIDLVSYRKHGHNEGDEPSFTQPLLYAKIKAHPSPREVYAAKLAKDGTVSEADAQALIDQCISGFSAAQAIAKEKGELGKIKPFEGEWKGLKFPSEKDIFAPVNTTVDAETIQTLSKKLNQMPSDFHIHPKLTRFFEARLRAVQEGKGIDWGNGESLAYATLLSEGHTVRITGQDVKRGTFTHRHAVVFDYENGRPYNPFTQIAKAPFEIYNSTLSEAGVLGFEFGYSLEAPKALVIWEAQFGDFSNSAQVIIDQYLSSSESKWQKPSGLVLLLPHGYEGQGPEHSSARLERFLQLCGRNNLIVTNLTTPAQIFHALRRQVKRDFRKPLIVMSPKSLLRNTLAQSTLDDFTKTSFQEVISDHEAEVTAKQVKRVVISSGKIYYDLLNERTQGKHTHVALVRVEQLYPWPAAQVAEELAKYSGAKDLVWVQEEPKNMGSWSFVLQQIENKVPLKYIGRAVGAAPAAGSIKTHEIEQKAILEEVFSK